MTITSKEITPEFHVQVKKTSGGQFLDRCYSCGACSGVCPVSQAIPDFDPRRIIHMIRMGVKEKLLSSELIWFCSNCRSCVFVCPQAVRFAEIVGALYTIAEDEGYVTQEDLIAKGKSAVVDSDRCVSCLTCVRVCPWEVPRMNDGGKATIDVHGCRACGICVEECPARAITLNLAEDERLLAACDAA